MDHSNLKYPNMRDELLAHLRALSEPRPGPEDFDEAIHFLFDDTQLASDPRSTIGWFLGTNEEADAIARLTKSLDEIFQNHGTQLADSAYLALPEWSHIASVARQARKAFEPGNVV